MTKTQTMSEKNIQSIRKQTRLALPEDDFYLLRLGVALYGFNSLSSFMAEVTCHLDGTLDRTKLEEKSAGKILEYFNKTLEIAKNNNPEIEVPGRCAAVLFKKMNGERSDFVHSYPITNKSGQQILHRRHDTNQKYFEITNDFLDDFISRIVNVNDKLYEIREIVGRGSTK